jgi:hypothetical protein
MSMLIWIVLTLLFLKVFWNFTLPFRMLNEARVNPSGKAKGISVSLEIEILLLLIALALSAFSTGESWVNSPKSVGIWAGGAILASYLSFFLVGAIGVKLITRFNKLDPPDSPPPTPRG